MRELQFLLPPWATFSFQMAQGGRALLRATEGIDLAEYIPRAVAAYQRKEKSWPPPS